ncbi:NAD(P)-dependent alcohol dehydrogenase [Dactylosporangium sp. AC04546]|uniref:NAD(P)-dependent alcohol dehydrogenase n=1 Tax=Dactylosporangium sp. AC04546 TaxID=2862460 RepID=UPI001EDF3A64|nr:NAD(P)-dependent alcohol dehydrogenase [Dactylosporangium sp. AC04546]WVK81533.1 NAD(P)-dependent alcohol dehydrogenase [Dactylosporangium sp. AC04546]
MRAVMFREYGPPSVLTAVDVPVPETRPGQVLVRVHATTVTSAECGMRRGEPRWGRVILGLRRPRKGIRVLGLEFAGEVAATGAGVRRFSLGDRVFGFTGFGVGANAEYKAIAERASVAPMPAGLSYAEGAASVDGFTTAYYFLHDLANVRPGQKVLVIGASGSIGTYAVQLARHFGAEVHGVCSGRNAALVTSLGASRVHDYTVEDFTTSGESYDAVFDTVGRSSFEACRPVLARNGSYLPTTGLVNNVLAVRTAVTGGPRVRTGMSVRKHAALAKLCELVEAGELRIVIDRRYPLADLAEAHRYVDTGRKVGNVVITLTEQAG